MTAENALASTAENALASTTETAGLTTHTPIEKGVSSPVEKSTETDIASSNSPVPKQKQAAIFAAITALKRQIRLNEIANDGYYLSRQRKEDEAALAEWMRRLRECETKT